DDTTLGELVDEIASKIVACGDKASCDEEALADYELKVARALAGSSAVKRAPGRLGVLAAMMSEAARAELGQATGLVEVLGRMGDHFYDKTNVMTPIVDLAWSDTTTDPFARA